MVGRCNTALQSQLQAEISEMFPDVLLKEAMVNATPESDEEDEGEAEPKAKGRRVDKAPDEKDVCIVACCDTCILEKGSTGQCLSTCPLGDTMQMDIDGLTPEGLQA